MQENNNVVNHSIIVENRKQISISGVSECIEFDDETILLDSKLGKLTIKGNGLHILAFNNDTGEFSAEGRIHAVAYTQNDSKQSFISKLIR